MLRSGYTKIYFILDGTSVQGSGRHLLSVNCTPPAIEQFPRPLLSPELRREGGVLLYILVSLYMFLLLAIVCDDYFVPSLECISSGK